MGQRIMLCPRQMFDVEMEPGQTLLQPEPCLILGNIMDFPNPGYHPVLPAAGNIGNLDLRHFPSHHDGCIFYRNQYNNLQHHHPIANLDLAVNPPPNFSYNPYMIPSSTNGICHIPLNHGSAQHVPSSSNSRILGVGLEEFSRATHLMDHGRGSCKRKNSEGILGSYYNGNNPTSSSSSLGVQQEEPSGTGIGIIDAPALTSVTEGSHRSVRSRASGVGAHLDSAVVHHHNRFPQGNYVGRPVHSANNGWVDHFGNNSSDMGGSSWNYGSALHTSFIPTGRSLNGGSAELGDMSGDVYQHQHHHPPMHAMRGGQNFGYHAQLSGPSYRHLVNNHLHHATMNSSQDGLESGSRFQRPFPSGGERINRPLRRVSHAPPEDSNARMRMLSLEDVAMLEFSGFYGVGNLIDQHRDMRLDIDDMSYEELLALGERIGDVKTGLSEESISKCLKTRIHVSSAASSLDEPADMAQDNGSCIICQLEYEDQEKVGKLDCGHEYHTDCIKQWLLVKNFCPICKANVLSEDKKEG